MGAKVAARTRKNLAVRRTSGTFGRYSDINRPKFGGWERFARRCPTDLAFCNAFDGLGHGISQGYVAGVWRSATKAREGVAEMTFWMLVRYIFAGVLLVVAFVVAASIVLVLFPLFLVGAVLFALVPSRY